MATSAITDEPSHYMWRDENGVLNFSETAPAGVEYETVENNSAPPFGYRDRTESEGEVVPPEAVQQILERTRKKESGEINAGSVAQKNAEIRARSCEAAKRNLATLQSFKEALMRGDDGVWREIDDTRKNAEIAEVEAVIAENCLAGAEGQ